MTKNACVDQLCNYIVQDGAIKPISSKTKQDLFYFLDNLHNGKTDIAEQWRRIIFYQTEKPDKNSVDNTLESVQPTHAKGLRAKFALQCNYAFK